VEQNPFKKLIDITDLMDFEINPMEVEKECQNILLRHNSELKNWYQIYAKKIEVTKREESFSMTLRQVWRFLRDCEIAAPDATLAQFNRLYNAGKKNHFTLLMNDEISKFDYLYNTKNSVNVNKKVKSDDCTSSDEDEEENAAELHKKLGIQPEDVHDELKIVL
jgi:hypothetical protein